MNIQYSSTYTALAIKVFGAFARPDALGLLGAFVTKASGSLLTLLMMTLAARAMGSQAFGHLTMAFALLSFTAILTNLGQEVFVMRSWGEYVAAGHEDRALQMLSYSSLVVISTACFVCILIGALGYKWNQIWFAFGAAAFLLAYASLVLSTHVTRAVVGIGSADTLSEIVWRLLVSIVAGVSILIGLRFTEAEFLFTASIGMSLCIGLQIRSVMLALQNFEIQASVPFEWRPWLKRSLPLWLGSGLEAGNQFLDVIVIGIVLSPYDAGIYFVASRLANVFAVVSGAIYIAGSREIAISYFSTQKHTLQTTFLKLTLITSFVVVCGLSGLFVLGPFLLDLFGREFGAGYSSLMLLAFGAGVGALGGPAPALMRLTGQEVAYAGVAAMTTIGRLVLLAVLGRIFGLQGAALASLIVACAGTYVLSAMCWKRTGLDPSAFAIFRRAGRSRDIGQQEGK